MLTAKQRSYIQDLLDQNMPPEEITNKVAETLDTVLEIAKAGETTETVKKGWFQRFQRRFRKVTTDKIK